MSLLSLSFSHPLLPIFLSPSAILFFLSLLQSPSSNHPYSLVFLSPSAILFPLSSFGLDIPTKPHRKRKADNGYLCLAILEYFTGSPKAREFYFFLCFLFFLFLYFYSFILIHLFIETGRYIYAPVCLSGVS